MENSDVPYFSVAEKRCLNSELWHACAGPLVSLPTLGSRVVYFPQGHSEQVLYAIFQLVQTLTEYNWKSMSTNIVTLVIIACQHSYMTNLRNQVLLYSVFLFISH